MDKNLLRRLDSAYGSSAGIGKDHVFHNPYYGCLLHLVNGKMKLPVLGKANTGIQIPLEQLQSATGKFPNAAVEIAFYEQLRLERLKLPVPTDYYSRSTRAMNALYSLNTSTCVVVKKDGKYSIRTSSTDILKSFPNELLENYSNRRHEAYLAVDARQDIEHGVLKSIELRGTDRHRLRLYCVKTQLKNCTIVPAFIAIAFIRKLLRILTNNIVTVRYKQTNGNILTFTTSLRMDFLNRHCGKNAEVIRNRYLNICNPMELTVPILPKETGTAKIFTMNIFNICSICRKGK